MKPKSGRPSTATVKLSSSHHTAHNYRCYHTRFVCSCGRTDAACMLTMETCCTTEGTHWAQVAVGAPRTLEGNSKKIWTFLFIAKVNKQPSHEVQLVVLHDLLTAHTEALADFPRFLSSVSCSRRCGTRATRQPMSGRRFAPTTPCSQKGTNTPQ